MTLQRLLRINGAGGIEFEELPDQPEEDEFDELDEIDDGDNLNGTVEVEPEVPVSDAKHDRVVLTIVALVSVGALMLVLALTILTRVGAFGSVCDETLHTLMARCGPQNNSVQPSSTSPYMWSATVVPLR